MTYTTSIDHGCGQSKMCTDEGACCTKTTYEKDEEHFTEYQCLSSEAAAGLMDLLEFLGSKHLKMECLEEDKKVVFSNWLLDKYNDLKAHPIQYGEFIKTSFMALAVGLLTFFY